MASPGMPLRQNKFKVLLQGSNTGCDRQPNAIGDGPNGGGAPPSPALASSRKCHEGMLICSAANRGSARLK
jgi:hypothetical protein